MLRATLRTALAHKGRLLLSTLAVILGVAFVTGTLMLTAALDRTFVDIIEGSAADVQVTRASAVGLDLTTDPGDSQPLLVSQEVVDQIITVGGVAKADGAVSRNGVYLIDDQGDVVGAVGPPAIGLSWNSDPELGPGTVTQGTAPKEDNEIVVDDTTFPRIGAEIGDEVRVITPSGDIRVKLVGTFKFGETGGLAGATLTAFTPDRAQELLAEKGQWTTAVVAVADGATDDQVAESISATLTDDDLVVTTRAQQVEQESTSFRESLAFFNYILIGFAVISMFVATFLIYNTFSILVAQRGQELALMRAIGATRKQVRRSVLVEALLMAAGAVLLGIGVGYLLALGLAALFGTFGLSLTAGISLTPASIIWAAVVGVIVTLLSALIPAVRASRIPPVAALREVGSEKEGISWVRAGIGMVLLLISGALIYFGLQQGETSTRASLTALGALLLLVAVIFLSPALAVGLVRLISPILHLLGRSTGTLAARNAARSPRRLATTASALTIGLGLVVSVTIITSSAKASLGDLVDSSFKSDFIVATLAFQPFDTEIGEDIAKIEGVEYVVSESGGPIEIDGEVQKISAVGGGPLDAVYSMENVTGEFGTLTADAAVVSHDAADENGWTIGEEVTVSFPSGKDATFRIVGEYDSTTLLSGLVISLEKYREVGGAAQDRFLNITLTPEADPAAVLEQVETIADRNPLLSVLDQAEIKKQNAAQLNQLLFFVYAMLALSIVIAALGVVNTLALSVIERTREIGLLRAVGATRRQIRRIIRWEAVVVALLGAVLGIAVGIGAGVALQRALVDSGITRLDMPYGTLLVILIMALLIGVLAAVLPARRAARLNILESIATE